MVLIVLYGIETLSAAYQCIAGIFVLIVLYGIETKLDPVTGKPCKVLIVLYGIETNHPSAKPRPSQGLKGTLFN